jgi:hypothetical protein
VQQFGIASTSGNNADLGVSIALPRFALFRGTYSNELARHLANRYASTYRELDAGPSLSCAHYQGRLGGLSFNLITSEGRYTVRGAVQHESYLLVLMLETTATYAVDGHRFKLAPGQIALYNPLAEIEATHSGRARYIFVEVGK